MDRLNPLDAVFVDAEDADPHVSMAIASIAVFEGPAPPTRSSWPTWPGGCRSCPATGTSSAPFRCASAGRSG